MVVPRRLIERRIITPKLNWGQNFMVQGWVADALIGAAKIDSNDRVIEVGAGLGGLTEPLLKRAGFVFAYEVDNQFRPYLEDLAKKYANLEVRMENIRKAKLPLNFNKVVGNIPYHISEPLVWKFRQIPVELMVFVMGIQFARKLTADISQKEYGDVSVIFQAGFNVSIEKEIPKESFYPLPPTTSALVKMVPLPINAFLDDPGRYVLRYIWDRKEMKLKNALREAVINWVAEITKKTRQLTKREATVFVNRLGLSEEKLEKIVDSGECAVVAKCLRGLNFKNLRISVGVGTVA